MWKHTIGNFARYRNQILVSIIILPRNLPSIIPGFQSPITVKALVKAVPSVRLGSQFSKKENPPLPPPLFELHIVEYLSSTTIFYPKRVNLLRFQACFQILGTVKEERLHSKRVASSHRKRKSNKGIRNPESEDGSEQIESNDIPFKNLI